MRKIKKLIIISLGVFCPLIGAAQDIVDNAINFSNTSTWGTARTRAMGGVGYSFGGDISSIHLNPAGLGFYNRNDISITPVVDFLGTDADYLNTSTSESNNRFNIGNLGVVFNNSSDALVGSGGWRGGSFGFSINRINNFSRDIRYTGSNSFDSFVEYAYADREFDNDYLIALAYDTYILETITRPDGSTADTTFIAPPTEEFPVAQSESIERRGGQYRYSLSYGANYADKLYIGLGLGFYNIDYEQVRTYSEVHSETELDALTLTEFLDIQGSGFDVSVGLIYRPVENLTIGARYKSPTWYSVEENFQSTLQTFFLEPVVEDFEQTLIFNPFDYNLQTPSQIGGGLTYFFDNAGFLSVDAEYVNYGGINLSGGGFELDPENEYIEEITASAVNVRGGGEVRFDPFRFRAGVAYYGDPVSGADDLDRSRMEYSGGVGYRQGNFYADFAVTHSTSQSALTPYPGAEFAIFDNKITSGSLTIGVTF